MTIKQTGAACPSCGTACPAEYAQMGQPPKWSCSCGAGGPLAGAFTGRTPPVSAAPAPLKKHWREKGRAP